MKYPHQIDSRFFKKMISSGWYEERNITLDTLPHHLETLPNKVKNFLREIWYISISDDVYLFNNEDSFYHYYNVLYQFGETTKSLIDYSQDDEDLNIYKQLVGESIRNFGFTEYCRELLIDELGRIFLILDSGDIYYSGGSFYEGIYNIIFDKRKWYLIGEKGKLISELNGKLIDTGLTLNSMK